MRREAKCYARFRRIDATQDSAGKMFHKVLRKKKINNLEATRLNEHVETK